MVPGDMPCNYTCEAKWCRYNIGGCCSDNATCERRIHDGCRVAEEEEDEE